MRAVATKNAVFSREVVEMNWQENLLKSPEEIRGLLNRTKRIAVLGIKT